VERADVLIWIEGSRGVIAEKQDSFLSEDLMICHHRPYISNSRRIPGRPFGQMKPGKLSVMLSKASATDHWRVPSNILAPSCKASLMSWIGYLRPLSRESF
jgi:hypothetical protein